MIRRLLLLVLPIVILACGGKGNKKGMSDAEASVYEETMAKVRTMEGRLANLPSSSLDEVLGYLKDVSSLAYRNDTPGMSC